MFIDYDSDYEIFYNNYYFSGYNIVLKIPLADVKEKTYERIPKIEAFDLTKYKYLLHYE